jgi:hypothetical protein
MLHSDKPGLKCAKAATLRAAFPEEADYTAEEMEGKVIEADGMPASVGRLFKRRFGGQRRRRQRHGRGHRG